MLDTTKVEALNTTLNQRLEKLAETIKNLQKKSNKSLVLRLVECGKHCEMCPHPRWEKWGNIQHGYAIAGRQCKVVKQHGSLLGAKYLDPETKDAIREAMRLIKMRKGLGQHVRRLKGYTNACIQQL